MEQKVNGDAKASSGKHAAELDSLLKSTIPQLLEFLHRADDDLAAHISAPEKFTTGDSILVDQHNPAQLTSILSKFTTLNTPESPLIPSQLSETIQMLLRYSVNTSAPGFLDKLYASPSPPGILAELILAVLNTNLHVYAVSPVLTLIEKSVTRSLAALFGLTGPRAGGISCQGGSSSNMTAVVVARNTLYPQTKIHGNHVDGLDLVLFSSAHGHYSTEKAAQACGFGSSAVVPVPVDPTTGSMIPSELERLIQFAKSQGKRPFYVNATAGTTVLGSFDDFRAISAIAKRHKLWMHIDGAWGGSFIFSANRLREGILQGSKFADSIAINPHKMLGVPATCSFLLAKDLKQFHDANTLPAGYLFHGAEEETDGTTDMHLERNSVDEFESWVEPYDLADLTLQCGRRGDSLKMLLSWQYYGTIGFANRIDTAYDVASYFADQVQKSLDLSLVSTKPPPCFQVCFYYAPKGKMFASPESDAGSRNTAMAAKCGRRNSKITETITARLVPKGFMIDFAPPLEGREWQGKFFRVVVNLRTCRETVDRLLMMIEEIGRDVVNELGSI